MVVIGVHLAVLQNMPAAFAALVNKDAPPSAMAAVFSTRMLPEAVEPRAEPALPRPKRVSAPVVTRKTTSPRAENFEQNIPVAPVDSAQEAMNTIAAETPKVVQIPVEERIVVAAAAAPTAAPARPASTLEPRPLVLPAPLRIKYEVKGEVKGFPYFANGELLWEHDGANYFARLEISHFILGSRTQTSKGAITPQGLEPLRFGDKVRSEVAAHFERAKGKVSFSANAPDVPLQAGAQDQLSLFMQIASMLAGDPGRFTPGTQIPFQAIGPRSSEQWVFKVGETEMLKVVGTDMRAIKLTRDANGEYDPRGEVWLAPELGYLPVRIRLIQPDGDFVEQNMRSAQKP
jgi:hypothetical protein